MSVLHRHPYDESAEAFLRDLNELFADATRNIGDPAILQHTLDAGLRAVGGKRGFLALVHYETGDLDVVAVSGEGWHEDYKPMHLHLARETNRGITGHVALTG